MSSRRFEIEKKKLAVRRLSQQSAKRNLHSPQGNERFSFKTNLSAEELKLKRKKLQQRLGTLEGNPAKNPPNQNQPLRPGINRTWVKKDEPEQKKENPFVWRGGDLRKKLVPKDDGYEAPRVEESSGDKNIKEIKQFVTPPSFGHAQTSSLALTQTDAVFNPFAVALKSSENKTSNPEILKPSPQTKQGSFPTDNVLTQNLFGLPIANMNKRDDFGDGKQAETSPAKTNIFTGKADTVQSNPFALAFRTKDANVPQIQKPISYPESHPNKSSIGFSGADNSYAEPNIGLINPFASTAQVPKLGSVVNKQDQNSGSNSWKPVMGSGPFSGIQAGKQPELGSSLISNNLSIKLMQIPDELNDKEFLRSFFLRFGRISRVYHHVNTKSAIITFLDHASAANAKENGRILREGDSPISIFWHVAKPKSSNKLIAEGFSEAIGKPGIVVDGGKIPGDQPAIKSKDNAFSQIVVDFAKALKNTQAKDANEKAEVLEKIDQKIREGVKKETDLKKACLVIGTCPDMCPEKERYLREHQRRLAPYEIQTGTENADTFSGQFPVIDHTKAVKEYSRSSADQEEPLPHELRPPHVLKMTMDYLVMNVMDAADGNWADWYDFVWNRTRGIRKDITQQHLCDEISVELIEKCARFHVMCAHNLCEEDMNVFDPKINNENLTKCMQSLKHMYDDLYVQKGIICSNEAEFRCYQVLLNLNNTDVLREVMEFRQEVRDSREVKFALKVFKSLNSSNYVRFFKLLGVGSYLMACIMQRYFNQIRSKGLLLMNRAYQGPVSKPVPVPLTNIARLFAIDEIDEMSEFCQHYGFGVDEGLVYFSKSSYEVPETSFLPVRSGTIEKKRNCRFGEVVHGEPFPAPLQYNPTISFNAQGNYTGRYHELALSGIQKQDEKQADEMPLIADAASIAPASRSALKVEKQDVGQVTVSLVNSVIANEVLNLATEAAEQVELAIDVGKNLLEKLLAETITAEIRHLAAEEVTSHRCNRLLNDVSEGLLTEITVPHVKDVISECIAEERKRHNDEMRMLVSQIATETTRDFFEKSTKEFATESAKEILREEKGKKFLTILTGASQIVGREVIEKHISEEVVQISNDVIEEEIERRKANLGLLERKIVAARTSRLLKRWIHEFRTRRSIRETLQGFPACSARQSSPQAIQSLTRYKSHGADLPEYILLRNGAEISVSSVSSLERKRGRHRNAVEQYHRNMLSERLELLKPLDPTPLLKAISSNVRMKSAAKKGFSNLLVCFPEVSMSSSDQCIDGSVLREKFKINYESLADQVEDKIESLETLTSITSFTDGVLTNFCVKGLTASFEQETEAIRKSCELHGVSGVIFIIDVKSSREQWNSEREKLYSLLCLKPSEPPTPLLVVTLNQSTSQKEDIVTEGLELYKLQEENLCSSFEIVSITDAGKLNRKLAVALVSLIRNAPQFPQLKTKSLIKFIEEGLELYFYERLYEDGLKRRQVGASSQDPQAVIDLYNGVLDHLIKVCTSDRLGNLSWPSKSMLISNCKEYPQSNWNDAKNFEKLTNLIESLKLPELSQEARSDDCWDDQLQICLVYLRLVSDSYPANIHPSKLVSRIEQVLNQYKQKWKYRSRSTFLEFPWDSVIEECSIFILTSFQAQGSRYAVDGNSLVSYFQEDYRLFRPSSAWIEAAKSLRSVSSISGSSLSLVSSQNLSSRDEYIQNSINEANEDIYRIEESRSSIRSHDSENDISSLLQNLQKKQEFLDRSLCSEKLAYSRLSNVADSCLSEDDSAIIPNAVSPLVGVKRKRNTNINLLESRTSEPLAFLERTDSTGSINVETKRPKQLLEDKIDDLLKEVKFMRSTIKLDEFRYNDFINS